ncbi:MAG: NADH-quinone oxidoreductase subunit J [Longimicrobiales bacterium]|nr:NADH-quinone oxidoreductase subunit J [Longimicrobiales bacterium]
MVEILFFVFAAVAVGSALGVVLGRSPVASLLFMVSSLGSVAGIYILLEAHFLAAIQVIVYAGAIMVLFLFVIMLLNLGHDYQQDMKGWLSSLFLFLVTGTLAGVLAVRFGGAGEIDFLAEANSAVLDAALAEKGAVGVIADPLFTTYVVPFEITGILLLVAIVGALALAKRRVA